MKVHTGSRPFGADSTVRRSNAPGMLRADLCGLPNPEPVVEVARWASRLRPGQLLEVTTDDPCAHVDFTRWCAGSGIVIVEVHFVPGAAWRFLFRRSSTNKPSGPRRRGPRASQRVR